MLHLIFLVEEPSMRACLDGFLDNFLEDATHQIVDLGSKEQLQIQLPKLMKGYANRIRFSEPHLRVVVLLDQDDDVCTDLKKELERVAADYGLATKSQAGVGAPFQVVNRIVCKELEAWFFGDPEAVKQAYTRVHDNHFKQAHLRKPDEVPGKTALALLDTFARAGCFTDYANPRLQLGNRWKYLAAEKIGPLLDPDRNKSPSFQAFVAGVRALLTT